MPKNNQNRSRLYSEQEMGALIQRATELQQGSSDAFEHGLSILEIERIAAELGITPEHLRNAALELENQSHTHDSKGFWGTPFQIDLNRVVEGALTDEQWEEIVLMLRTYTGRAGRTNDIGKTKEWSHFLDEGLGHTRVSISPREEQSTVKIQKQYRGMGVFVYVLSFLLGGVITLILSELEGAPFVSIPMGLTFLGAGCVTALLAARTGLSIWSKRQQKKLDQMLNKVLDHFSPHQPLSDSIEPLIELPALSEEAVQFASKVNHNNSIKT